MATVMLLSTMSACVTLVSAETVSATEEIFTETFEDYTKDVNWLDNISDRHVTGVVPEGKEKDWFIYDGTVGSSGNKTKIYKGAPDAEIMVVDAGTLGLESDGVDRGQVLKIYGGAGENDKDLTLKRTVESITNMGTKSSTGGTTSGWGKSSYVKAADFLEESKGKKLVYEVKYYAPEDFYSNQASLMTFASTQYADAGYTPGGGILTTFASQYAYMITMGSSSKSHYARAYHFEKRDAKWHTIKVVTDYSDTANKDYWHTTRIYIDDKLVTAEYTMAPVAGSYLEGGANYTVANRANGTPGDSVYDFAPYSRVPTATSETETASAMTVGDVHGWFFGTVNMLKDSDGNSQDGKALYYVDDMKAYWIDELEIGTTVNTEMYKSGAIQIPFNSEIRETVTKYNPQYVNSSSTASGYNSVTRFGEKYTTSATKRPSKSTKTLGEVTNAEDALITIVDKDGKLIEGAVKSVELSSDKKTVLVTPDMTVLSGNTEYKIAIDPLFCDVYGQALTSKTTTKPVTTYVEFSTASADFTAKVDETSVSATAGDDISVVVTLSEVATEEDIENAFVVTNTKTNEVVENLNYELSAEGTKVTVDLSTLPAGSYKLTMNTFTASGKELVNADDIVVSISIAEKLSTDDIFNEDFENYEKDVNWLDNIADNNFVTSENTGVKENDWFIPSTAKGATGAEIMVVDAGDAGLESDGVDRGQVLKINGGNTTTTFLTLRKALNNITKMGTVADDRITYANFTKASAGKKLVYEVEYFVPSDFYTGEAHFMTLSASDAPPQYSAGGGSVYTAFSGSYAHLFANTGKSDATYYARTYQNFNDRGAWHTLKIVADFSEQSSKDNWNTVRTYYDSVLLTGNYTSKTPTSTYVIPDEAPYELGDNIYDFATSSPPTDTIPYPSRFVRIYGWAFSARNSASYDGQAVYYINNFKAYWIDELEVESMENADNYVDGEITINFNSAIKEDVEKFAPAYSTSYVQSRYKLTDKVSKNYKDLIRVVDTNGNVIENALTDVRLSANKRALIIKPNMEVLWGGRTYKVAIDPLFTDVFGQAFTGNVTSYPKTTFVSFTTAKNDSLSIKSASANLTTAGEAATNLTLVNLSGTAKTAFLAVAVYNKNHEMIGIWTGDVTVPANSEITQDMIIYIPGYAANDVASVKAHLWSSFEDMVPYQAAESIGF